jgi:hypothetical protein
VVAAVTDEVPAAAVADVFSTAASLQLEVGLSGGNTFLITKTFIITQEALSLN